MNLKGKTVLVGVSGGIAAYKSCMLVSALKKSGANVYVVMTHNATHFVGPLTFETLSGNRVTVDTFDRDFTWEVEHVSLAKKTDVVIVAPATANIIAKTACGIADDFLSTTLLACNPQKILICPAMNTAMLDNVATVGNIKTLEERGVKFIYGKSGRLACGDSGKGRMAEPEEILSELDNFFAEKKTDLSGKTVLVTAGSTRTALDPVRYITNRSSGKMGFAVAKAAYERGAKVIFIRGFTDKFDVSSDFKTVDVTTTEKMAEAVKKHLKDSDLAVFAAAPFDYAAVPSKNKIKSDVLDIRLQKTVDCAKWAGENKKAGVKTVIFAAETDNCEDNAINKLRAKKADMVVLNDVTKEGAGFEVDTNIATLITEKQKIELPLMTKSELADRILDEIIKL